MCRDRIKLVANVANHRSYTEAHGSKQRSVHLHPAHRAEKFMILEGRKMFRTERFKADASDERANHGVQSKITPLSSSQRGSILIGLIITMVVMAFLGAGMLSLTTTATFHELLFGKNAGASLAAESGGRYALAVIRDAYATNLGKLNAVNADQIFDMGSGSSFQITNWSQNGANPETVTFTSVGTVSSGFLQAKRQIKYGIQPANQSATPPPPVLPPEVSDFNVPKAKLDEYFSPIDMGEVDIKHTAAVQGDNALNLKSDFYTMGLKWYANPSEMAQLDAIRSYNNGLLSYGLQIKIEIDEDKQQSDYNMIGLSFRLDDTNTTTMTLDNMYGISFFKILNTGMHTPGWYSSSTTLIKTNPNWQGISDGTWYVVLWKRVGGGSGPHTLLAYKQLLPSDWVLDAGKINFWSTLRIKVVEAIAVAGDPYGFTAGARYNVTTSYLAANSQGTTGYPPQSSDLYLRRTTASPNEIEWSGTKFTPINWTVVSGSGAVAGSSANIVADSSLTTLNYDSYTATTNPKAREIGLHVYYDSQAAQYVFYDNFYIDFSSSTGGADGSGSVIQYP